MRALEAGHGQRRDGDEATSHFLENMVDAGELLGSRVGDREDSKSKSKRTPRDGEASLRGGRLMSAKSTRREHIPTSSEGTLWRPGPSGPFAEALWLGG